MFAKMKLIFFAVRGINDGKIYKEKQILSIFG